jgi:hypothetical protein
VREAYTAITALGAGVVAVGTGSVAQARQLMDAGMPFPCLVDAEARLYRALGFPRLGWRAALSPATYRNYWRAWRRGARQGTITGDPRRLSGVAIVDAEGRLRWRYASRTIGDYPPVDEVMGEVRRVRTPSP